MPDQLDLDRLRAVCDAADKAREIIAAIKDEIDASGGRFHWSDPETIQGFVDTLPAALSEIATLREENEKLRRMRDVVFERDEKDGCCAPGEWCCFKPYSELAVDHGNAVAEIAALRAELAASHEVGRALHARASAAESARDGLREALERIRDCEEKDEGDLAAYLQHIARAALARGEVEGG